MNRSTIIAGALRRYSVRYGGMVVVMIVLSATVSAQALSPLHYLITSNSLISRPGAFRDLQHGIDTQWTGLGKGAKLELLDERIKIVHERLAGFLGSITVKAEPIPSPTSLTIVIGATALTTSLPGQGITFARGMETLRSAIALRLRAELQRLTEDAVQGLEGAANPGLGTTLNDALAAVAGRYAGGSGGDLADRIASTVVDNLRRLLLRHIRDAIPGFNENAPGDWNTFVGLAAQGKGIDSVAKLALAEATTFAANLLNTAEQMVRSAIEAFNSWLVSGNAGLALTDGEGSLAGGIHLSYNSSTNLQAGVYFNGNFEPSDTAHPGYLMGLQLRVVAGEYQIDGLVSGVRADSWALEGGLGISRMFGASTQVGIAFFTLATAVEIAGKSTTGWSLGITAKGKSAGSMSLLLGVTRWNGQTRPLFQINYPITGEK